MSSSSEAFRPLTAVAVRADDVRTGGARLSAVLLANARQHHSIGSDERASSLSSPQSGVPSQRSGDVMTTVEQDAPAGRRPSQARGSSSRGSSPRRVSLPAFSAATKTAPPRPAEPVTARFVPLTEPDEHDATLATRDQARAVGFAAGFAAGSREAAKVAAADAQAAQARAQDAEAARADEHAQAMAVLATAVDAVRARCLPVLDTAEERLHAAALELATALLGVELSHAPTSARAALARVADAGVAGDVVVRMSPRDADVVAPPPGMSVVADPALAPGDAVAEHADGELDARITSALGRAQAALERAATEQAQGAGPHPAGLRPDPTERTR